MTISKNAEIRKLRAALQRARNYVAAAAEFEPSDDEPPSGPEVLAAIDAALVATSEAQVRHRILTLLERAVEGDRWTAEDLDRLVHDLASASEPPPAPAEEAASTWWEEQAKSELKKARIVSRRLDALLAARAPTPAIDDATVERLRAAVDVTLKAWDETYGPSESNEICEAMEILAAARRADEEVRRG
jgi:hypothetical protein